MTGPAHRRQPDETWPIYFINLARSADRRARMEQQLASWSGSVRRVEGVDGRTLGKLDLLRHQAPVRTLLRHGRLLRPGEIGTRLSHRKVYQQIIAGEPRAAIVLEDDTVVDFAALTLLIPQLEALELDWDAILLHNHSDLHPDKLYFVPLRALSGGFRLMGILDEPCSSGAYIISKGGAAKMLRMNRFDSPSDYWGWFALRTGLKVFAIDPVVGRIDRQFASEVDAIAMRRADREKRIFWLFKKSRKAFRNRVRRHCAASVRHLAPASAPDLGLHDSMCPAMAERGGGHTH
jgi:glycosyl transferase family 25